MTKKTSDYEAYLRVVDRIDRRRQVSNVFTSMAQASAQNPQALSYLGLAVGGTIAAVGALADVAWNTVAPINTKSAFAKSLKRYGADTPADLVTYVGLGLAGASGVNQLGRAVRDVISTLRVGGTSSKAESTAFDLPDQTLVVAPPAAAAVSFRR